MQNDQLRGRGRPELALGDILVGLAIQAMENDQSRDALSDRETLAKHSDLFEVAPPAPFTLRRNIFRRDVNKGWEYALREIAKIIHPIERWYILDATYFKTPYYRKQVQGVNEDTGEAVYKDVKNAKVFLMRGLKTGVPVAALVRDESFSDQTAFKLIFETLMDQGASIRGGGVIESLDDGPIRGGGIIADAGFNAGKNFQSVHAQGGQAFLAFDTTDPKSSKGKFPHFDEMLHLYLHHRDKYMETYNRRALIENTNHNIKTLYKRVLRAQREQSRECEAFAVIIVYALSRFPRLRLEKKIDLPFADEKALRFIDEELAPNRKRKTEFHSIGDLAVRGGFDVAFPWADSNDYRPDIIEQLIAEYDAEDSSATL
jgi:hypothetical protein